MANELGTFNELDTPVYYALVKDDVGATMDMTAVDAITLTLHEDTTGAILNGRIAQNVKNANQVTAYATAESATTSPSSAAAIATPAVPPRNCAAT